MKLQTVLPIYNSHYKFLPGFTTFILNGFIPTKKKNSCKLEQMRNKIETGHFQLHIYTSTKNVHKVQQKCTFC